MWPPRHSMLSGSTSKGSLHMTIQKLISITTLALLISVVAGCEKNQPGQGQTQAMDEKDHQKMSAVDSQRQSGQVLVAVMTPTAGNEAHGSVTFTGTDDGIMVTANIAGLTPGVHAIHIHQFGDLRKNDGKGTGGHYNPEGHDHALPESDTRHAGDLGNLTAGADGNSSYSILIHNVTFDGQHNPIIGRGVIIHAKADDGGQPTGNAGARVSQGTIGYANPG